MNTITLEVGGAFHTHRGFLNHDEIIGKVDGSVVSNNVGQQYQTLRPLLSDFVLSMPRGAAVVYPKDAAQIVTMADIFPARALSKPASVPAHCPFPCCAQSATAATSTRLSVARIRRHRPWKR